MPPIELTQSHVEEVNRIVQYVPNVTVKDVRLSDTRAQVIVTVALLRIDPATVIGNCYRQMKAQGATWYSITQMNQPGQPVETLLFGALK